MGINQEMIIYGPIPYENSKIKKETIVSVIDYCLNSSLINLGSTKGDLILNGIVTKESQEGWTVKKGDKTLDLRGAYSSVKNILNVPIRLVSSSVDFYFWVCYNIFNIYLFVLNCTLSKLFVYVNVSVTVL